MRSDTKKAQKPCCSQFKTFLVSLSFVYFAKAFQGSYMKSSVTQIERRFDIPSSLTGVIDGSFEMGNLLVVAFVSYFGAKFHRPRLIGIGCLIMTIGSLFTALPHFFQGRYKYETTILHSSMANSTESTIPCLANQTVQQDSDLLSEQGKAACEKEAGSSLWIYVLLGNMLRGIGETPVVPLGVSYLDDFAREENTAFYLALVQTVGILGPMFGFLLGSFCAKLYVDIGAVDMDTVSINHTDSRWVGAWWLGFLITGSITLLAAVPFFFLPRSLPKQGTGKVKASSAPVAEQDRFIVEEQSDSPHESPPPVNLMEMAKDFLPSLKRLFSNSIYLLLVLAYLVQINGFVGMITFKPKYMEQVYGQSQSKSIFIIGIMNLPAVALGIISGGIVMKRFKLGVLGAARVSIITSFVAFLMLVVQYFLQCGNAQVAGLTESYQGVKEVSHHPKSLLSQCNLNCSCSLKHWDPVCGHNGVTYASPCLAGCQASTGKGKDIVFHNCACVGSGQTLTAVNTTAFLGQCPRSPDCNRMFKFYMGVSVITSFLSACGATPGSIVLLRSIEPDLKSLAIGMQTLIVRTLGGIPPPIYFGALIDRTCLKWGSKRCGGGRGACRLYNADIFRLTFMGLIYGLYSTGYLLWGCLYIMIFRKQKRLALQSQVKAGVLEANGLNSDNKTKSKEDMEKESSI